MMGEVEEKSVMNKKSCLLLSLFCSFTLFGFAPLEMYFSIYEEVWFGFGHIIGLILLMFIAGFVGCFLFLCLLGKWKSKWNIHVCTLLFAVVMAAYIQGNFLPSDFGTMNGQAIDWSQYRVETGISVGIWCLFIGLSFWMLLRCGAKKFFYGTQVIMICVLLVQVVTLATVCFTTDGLKPKNSAGFLDKNLFSFSKEDNVIVLVVDMYDSQVFQEIYEEDGNEAYFDALDGFTYYPDMLGAYPLTKYAIPHILSGEKYVGELSEEENVNRAYVRSPMMTKLQEKGYDINIYTHVAIPTQKESYSMIQNYLPEEQSKMQISSKSKMIMYLAKLVGIRYLPQPLKQYCWFDTSELWDLRDVGYENWLYTTDNFAFNDRIKDADTDAQNQTFHFYHIDGTHTPCYYDENFSKTEENIGGQGNEGMLRNGKGMLVLIENFLQELKDLGIYDDSAIFIMADHGSIFRSGELNEELYSASPLFLAKGFGENHPLQVSDMCLSYDDLQAAFCQLLEGKIGEQIFSDADNKNGERYFFDYNMRQYRATGHAFEADKLEMVEETYGERDSS